MPNHEKSKAELRDARRILSEVIESNGFTREITPQTVSSLTNKGFSIGGHIGAQFTKAKGLTIWNKAQRNSGKSFTLKQLVRLEKELKETFDEIWSNN